MDSELRTVIWRYTLVGVAIAGAAFWTVELTAVDPKHAIGPPMVMVLDAGPAESPAGADGSEKAPALKDMFIVSNGQERVSCAAACRLEKYCSLRDVDSCMKASCEGTVRKLAQSDDMFAKAGDCVEAATSACGEACARCGKGDDIKLCTQNCTATTRSNPALGYQKARCMLEQPCSSCDPFVSAF